MGWRATPSLTLAGLFAIHALNAAPLDGQHTTPEDDAQVRGEPAASAEAFDHSDFDGLLREHVTPDGLVDYAAFADNPAFQGYLDDLAAAPLDRLSRDEQLAVWISAYNAYTIELINKHDERKSIRGINRTLGITRGSGPWRERHGARRRRGLHTR